MLWRLLCISKTICSLSELLPVSTAIWYPASSLRDDLSSLSVLSSRCALWNEVGVRQMPTRLFFAFLKNNAFVCPKMGWGYPQSITVKFQQTVHQRSHSNGMDRLPVRHAWTIHLFVLFCFVEKEPLVVSGHNKSYSTPLRNAWRTETTGSFLFWHRWDTQCGFLFVFSFIQYSHSQQSLGPLMSANRDLYTGTFGRMLLLLNVHQDGTQNSNTTETECQTALVAHRPHRTTTEEQKTHRTYVLWQQLPGYPQICNTRLKWTVNT